MWMSHIVCGMERMEYIIMFHTFHNARVKEATRTSAEERDTAVCEEAPVLVAITYIQPELPIRHSDNNRTRGRRQQNHISTLAIDSTPHHVT